MQAGRVFGRVIASGAIALLVATIALPTIWPDTPWIASVQAANCDKATHQIVLSAPNASPRTGTPTTWIQFTVTYLDTKGCPPTSLFAVVPGVGQVALTGTGNYANGVGFQGAMRLPVGTWHYQFVATSGSGGNVATGTAAGPGTIVISAPTPTPTPTPKPTPKPTPPPTPTPTPTPKPTPPPTPKPTPRPTPGATATPSPGTRPNAKPTAGPTSTGSSGSTSPGSGAGGPGPSQPPGGGGFVDHPGRDDAGGLGPPDNGGEPDSGFGLRLPGLDLDPSSALPLGTWLATTTFGVLLFAVVFRGRGLAVELPGELSVLVMKRRRAARGGLRESNDGLPDGGVDLGAAATVVQAAPGAATTATDFDEARRQVGATGRPPRRFARPPAKGVDRRVIAYRSVRVSAGPDELRTAELTRLDRRDEVEVIGEDGGSLQIRTPDGVEGWVPRVVLVGAPPAEGAAPAAESESATKPRRRRVPALRRGPTVIDPTQPTGGT